MKKNSQLLSRGEFLFLGAVTLILVGAVVLLSVAGQNHIVAEGEAIGTVTFKNQYAGRKVSGQVLWDVVSQNGPVYNLDSIRTAANSSAIIHLKNNIEISLAEESLILLDLAPLQTKLNVIGGSVVVQNTAASAPAAGGQKAPALVLSTSAGDVELKSGGMSVTDNGKGVNMNLMNGEAVLKTSAGEQTMSGNASVDSSGKVSVITLVPASPPNGSLVLTDSSNPSVQFQWQSSQSTDVMLTVASDRAFTKIESQAKLSDNQSNLTLPSGNHYWKVSTAGDSSQASMVSWFTVQNILPPRLIAPIDRSFRTDTGQASPIGFSWTPSNTATAYRIEISDKAGSKNPVVSTTTALSSLTIDTLKEGDYSWTVTSLSGPKSIESTSVAANFSIVAAPLQALVIAPPDSARSGASGSSGGATQVSSVAVGNGAVLASWDPVEGAASYVATVSRDAKGTDIVSTVSTTSNFLQLNQTLDVGTYYIRVQAVSATSKSPTSSSLQVSVIEPVKPQNVFPLANAQLDPTVRDLRFRWSDQNQGHFYRLQVSSDQNFANLVTDKVVEGREAVISYAENVSGNLAWKVSLLDDKKQLIADSNPTAMLLPRLLDSPRILTPTDGSDIDVNKIEKIDFTWQPVAYADEYQLNLYRVTSGLKSLVQSWRSKDPKVLLDRFEDLAVGSFSWELRALKNPTDGVPGQSRLANAYFKLFQSAPLVAPVLNLKVGGQ